MAYLSPLQAMSVFLSDNWTETKVCYPNAPEPDLEGENHWLQVWIFTTTQQTTLGSTNRVTDQGTFWLDIVGEQGTGIIKHNELCGKLAKLFQSAYVNGVSMQGAYIDPQTGYNAQGRYVMRVKCDYVLDYEY